MACGFRRAMAVLGGLLLVPALGRAAEVAILKSTEVPLWRPALEALRERAPGHQFTEHDLQGDEEKARRLVAALRGPAVLVAVGPLAARVAREVAPNTPLVYCMVLEPERLALVDQPRVAGVVFGMPMKNQLAAFRLVNPAATRIGVVYSPDELGDYVRQAREVAAKLQVNLVERPVRSEQELPAALKELLRGAEPVDALWMLTDPLLLWDENRQLMFKEARKAGKPVYGFSAGQVEEGALVSHGADLVSVGEQAALLVNRLTGREAGPTTELLVPKAEIVVNATLAKRLKITLSKEALQAATKVR